MSSGGRERELIAEVRHLQRFTRSDVGDATYEVVFPFSGEATPLGINVKMRVHVNATGHQSRCAVVSSNPEGYDVGEGDVIAAVNGDSIPDTCQDPVRQLAALVRNVKAAHRDVVLSFRKDLRGCLFSPPKRLAKRSSASASNGTDDKENKDISHRSKDPVVLSPKVTKLSTIATTSAKGDPVEMAVS